VSPAAIWITEAANGHSYRVREYKSNCVKLALILVRLANPAEAFSDEEEMLVSKGIAAVPVAG
jgi:hypothetical protein